MLLALRTLSTTLSLGSIRLYQSTATSLLSSVRQSTSTLEAAFQSIFYLAAFCEATEHPESEELGRRRGVEMIDYESARLEGGMRIEARDLGLTYPGVTKPTLSGINLSVQPGETLAIVGFNGGGKTTLVKALMGLYEHSGELNINGRSVDSYLPESLHRRTSCLFQDFSRYSLTLRENVGIGDVARMDDSGVINLAIDRGGAEKIREKVGLEGKLDRVGVPDTAEGEGGGNITASADVENGTKIQPASPPNGLGRGRGGGGRSMAGLIIGLTRIVRRGGEGGSAGVVGGSPRGDRDRAQIPLVAPPPGAPGAAKYGVAPSKEKEEEKRAALSGGQWQRVALARAFLRADEADLVVFECVSSRVAVHHSTLADQQSVV